MEFHRSKVRLEPIKVPTIGPEPSVDQLIRISDHEHVAMLITAEDPKQLELKRARILSLVNEDELINPPVMASDFWIFREKFVCPREHRVKVKGTVSTKHVVIGGIGIS